MAKFKILIAFGMVRTINRWKHARKI